MDLLKRAELVARQVVINDGHDPDAIMPGTGRTRLANIVQAARHWVVAYEAALAITHTPDLLEALLGLEADAASYVVAVKLPPDERDGYATSEDLEAQCAAARAVIETYNSKE